MDHEEISFEEFLAARMRDKGISLKRLAEATGIAPSHLENMLHGNFEDMPSTPYFHGYVVRIAKILEFDGEEWWGKLRTGGMVANSGELDKLPKNRFIKQSPQKLLWVIGVAVILLIYLVFQAPRVLGKPSLTITFPAQNPYTTSSSTLTITGSAANADIIYLSSGNATSGEQVAIAPDGTWQKTVLLQNGLNPFEITAKKFLGGQTNILEQILYESPTSGGATVTSTLSFPSIHMQSNTPATGSYFQ